MNMDHAHIDNDPATDCDLFLAKVNLIYQEIGTIYCQLEKEVTGISPAIVEEKLTILNNLIETARKIDRDISTSLLALPVFRESTGKLLVTRNAMVQKLYRTNRNIVNRAENVKTLLRHEIVSMNKNRHALQGYRPPEMDRKSIVRETY